MDLITYVADIQAMGVEGAEIAASEDSPLRGLFSLDEDGGLSFNVIKIPVKYISGNKSLCLCRGLSREAIALSTTIQVLGECINNEYVFDSEEAKDLYEATYDTTTRLVDDGEGGTFEHTPPYMIGVFA